MTFTKLAPWLGGAAALAAALVVAAQPLPQARGFDVAGFGALPVLEGGRVKPLDSVARNALLVIHGKQTLREGGRELSADEWALDVLYRPEIATKQEIFDVDDPDVLGLLGRQQTSDRYLSFKDLEPHLDELQRQGQAALAIEAQRRSRFQSSIVTLYERLQLFHRLANTLHLWDEASLEDEIANRAQPAAKESQTALAQLALFRPLAPRVGEGDDGWRSVGEALTASAQGPADARLLPFAKLETAYLHDAPWAFNAAVQQIQSGLAVDHPALARATWREVVFNRAEPFYVGMGIYLLALLVVFVSWLWPAAALPALAFGLLCGGALVHTAGLLARSLIQGRPPVTNLYSSAVFVGFVVVLLGIVLQRVYRRSFATGVTAAVGFTTLLIAHHLSAEGDTLEMMRAVLDSNFWLGTHVVTVTIGYSGTFLAGSIAVGYALRRQLVAHPNPETSRALLSMTYGVLCFSLFFSFVGTVLGGIWADQSWGRFWGWDPKENGALLIVLWNSVILHARMGGFIREKGLMAMAIGGNIVTSLSWFGVNMLGIGLHSYGFMDKAFWALSVFIGAQLLLIGAALLPPFALGRGGRKAPVAPPSPNPA